MLIAGMNKTTLLDYPGCVAATVFVGGCNFRCPFCHNGGLVLDPLSQKSYSEEEILEFLRKRKKILKGVCITGGEPTLHADLPEFILKIKELGYRVKLDTNGYAPNVLKELIDWKLLDYVAMDIKNCPDKYALTAGMSGSFDIDRIKQSVNILKTSSVLYELRTTVVKEFHTKEDLLKIAGWIQGCPHYYLQQYQNNENILDRIVHNSAGIDNGEESASRGYFHGYDKEEMEHIAEALRKIPGMTEKVALRGIGV